jgi:small subunit ribosomal protein S16
MALKIRMSRRGTTNLPFYHIVVADGRAPRDGAYLEKVGSYNPLEKDSAKKVQLQVESIKTWISKGAQPSARVAKFLGQAGVTAMPKWNEQPQKSAPKKKSQDRATAKAEKAAALAEAAAVPKEAPAPAPVEAPAAEAPAADEAAA